MKRLYSTASWRLRQERRRRKLERRRASSRHRVQRLQRLKAHRPHLRGEATIVAPTVLSFKINPKGSCAFVSDLREATTLRKRVHLDLASVTRITTEAVAVLLACVTSCRNGVSITGNLPNNSDALDFLRDSGFFDHVEGPRIDRPKRGILRTRERFKVSPDLAQSLTAHVNNGLPGLALHVQPSYRMLIEAMANTREHAQSQARPDVHRQTNWWAASAFDENKGEGYFACVDIGVGIFNSLQLRNLRQKLLAKAGFVSNADLLRDILLGKVQSTTGLPYRGKGLPSMYRASSAGRIRRLVILSNDACADVDKGTYFLVDPPFRGTIVAWEVGKEQV
jgi:hypothetical protein